MKNGSKMTEEQRKKISEYMKGKTPKNINLLLKRAVKFRKGQIPWNKNMKVDRTKFPSMGHFKKNSEETKRKIREATKKVMANPEIRKKLSRLKKGKPSWNKGVKTGISPWIKGKRHSEDARKKMIKAVEKRLSDPAFLKKLKEIHKQRLSNPEEMKRQVEVSRRTLLKLYESGAFPKQTNTKIERDIKDELVKRGYKEGIDFIHQFKFMNKFMCDFCFPEQKVIVEAYGDFWHCNPDKYPSGCKIHPHQIKGLKRDKAKEAYIRKVDNGSWDLIIIWESDIKKNIAKCVDRIEEVLKKKK